MHGTLQMYDPTQPVHETITRGMYDSTVGMYDTTAGPRANLGSPLITQRNVPPLPGYAGERLIITRNACDAWINTLMEHHLIDACTAYVHPTQRDMIAVYNRRNHVVAWHARAPDDLRTAAMILHRIEPPLT